MLGQPSEHVGQVILRIDAAPAAADDDRVNDGAAPAGIRVADEQPALLSDCGRADVVFDKVMPTSGLCRHGEPGSGSTGYAATSSRHNQRPSRKASKRCGGRYREKRADRFGIQRIRREASRLGHPIGKEITSIRLVDKHRVFGQDPLSAQVMQVALRQLLDGRSAVSGAHPLAHS